MSSVSSVFKKELKWNTDNADYTGLHGWPYCIRPENKLHNYCRSKFRECRRHS
jgi:hypothetical protein